MNMLRVFAVAASLASFGTRAVADGPPNIVFDRFEFLPAFTNHGFVQVTSVNNHGDFCGYFAGASPQEFEYLGNEPHAGGSSMISRCINDSQVTVGDMSDSFPGSGFIRIGTSFGSSFSNRSFRGVNNKGWIVGFRPGNSQPGPGIRRDDLGETELPSDDITWLNINDEGTVYGSLRVGAAKQIVMKTRFGAVQNLGTFGGDGAEAVHVNTNGDIAGFTFDASENPHLDVGLAVVGGVVQHFHSVTQNHAHALAVTLDGQVIGTDFPECSSTCHGKVWVVKNGVRHDLAAEIAEAIGVLPDFVQAMAASETGWIIASGFDPRDHSYHLIRLKIQVDIDTDGDGLLDFWESPDGGIDINLDGTIDFRPYDHGARPDHKDVFLEVDAGTLSLSDIATSRVLFAFENAPVDNPDGSRGIHLHIQQDEAGVLFQDAVSLGEFPEGFAATKASHFGTVQERADVNSAAILAAKARVFRYCVLYDGIDFSGSTSPYNGIAELGGNDFVVNIAGLIFHDGYRDIDDQAATFMHELGHTLGLHHGGGIDELAGGEDAKSKHGKPNYPSIMNYALTHPMRWSRRFWTLDYCREELGTLNEDSLDESAGIRSTLYRGYSMPYGAGPALAREFHLARLDGRGIDFDSDGVISSRRNPVQEDLNFLPAAANISGTQTPTPGEIMHGNNDWANLVYRVVADDREFEHDITIAAGCPSSESVAYLDGAIPMPCFADFNDDGVLDFFDYLDFVGEFASGSMAADFNSDEIVDFFDYLDFVLEFAGGC